MDLARRTAEHGDDGDGDAEPDDGVGSFEAGPYTNGAEGDGESGEAVRAGVVAVSDESGRATIWDRLFGTVARRDTTPDERFGVPGQVDTYPQRFATAARQPLLDIQATRRVRRAIGR